MRYRVRNWQQFQHYRDRNPPWIKLHFAMLSSVDWVTLDDRARVLAVACMLIASRNGGEVPGDPGYLKRVAYLNSAPNFKPLIECGFLEVASDCKQMLATARPEVETETETETEERARKRATRLPANWQPSEAEAAYAKGKGLDVAKTAELFRNYWHAKSSNATKLDWTATWRNWCINEADRTPANRKPDVRRIETPPTQDQVEAARRKAAADNAALHAKLAGVIGRVA